jgi:hypothetical protein
MKKEQEMMNTARGADEMPAAKAAEGIRGAREGKLGAAPPSRDAFAALVMDCCLEYDRNRKLTYDPTEFEIADEATGVRMCLSNVYAQYCFVEESHRQDIIAQFTRVAFQTPKLPSSFSEAKDLLLPVIRNRWASDIAVLGKTPDDGADALSRRLTDNLAVGVVYDLPDTVLYIQTNDLKGWGVSEDAVFAAAIGNMRKHTEDRVLRGRSTSVIEDLGFWRLADYPRLFTAPKDDWFCSSRILVEDWIRSLPLKGQPVAMITHQGVLFVAGTEDAKSLVGMAELAKFMHGRSHRVSNVPIRLGPRGWETYQPPRNHPAFGPFRSLRSEEMTALYTQQLRTLQWRPGLDHFLSSCTPVAVAADRIDTRTVWARNADCLLPKTDWVSFASVDPNDKAKVHVMMPVPWDAVHTIVGHRMEISEFSPPRYRARGFPSEKELARLMKAATRGGFPLPWYGAAGAARRATEAD